MGRLTGKNAKLSDVAERAGVSKATASNVFNRPQLVREEVRARVLEAAKAVGYAGPDPKGRMLSGGKVNAIGVATAEPLSYFFEDPYARILLRGHGREREQLVVEREVGGLQPALRAEHEHECRDREPDCNGGDER